MDINTESRIKNAFENTTYEWRTIRGVAKEINVSQDIVRNYIASHGDDIVKSPALNENGEQLYASRKVRRTTSSLGVRISSSIRNRGA